MKSNKNWGNRRLGTNSKGQLDQTREEKWKTEYERVCEKLELLSDPYDNMSLDEKKSHGLYLF